MHTTRPKSLRRHAALTSILFGLSSSLLGCSSDAETTATTPSAQAVKDEKPPTPEVKTVADLATPAEVIAFGGMKGASAVLASATKIGRSIDPSTPDLDKMLPQAIAEEVGLKDASAIDLSKPMHFAVFDPKAMQDAGMVFTFAATKDAFVKALPDDKKEGDGHAFSWTKGSKTFFADFEGDVVIITADKGLFEKHKEFFRQLAVADLPAQGAAVIDVAHIRTLYQSDIDQGFAMMKQQMTQPSPFGGPDPTKMGPIVDWVKKHFGDMEKVVISTEVGDERSSLGFEFRYTDGSDAKKLFSKEVKAATMHARLPKNTPAFFVGNFAPYREELSSMLKWAMTMSFQGGDGLTEATDAFWQATTGEFAYGVVPMEGEGLAVLALTGINDADKARVAQREIGEAYAKDPEAKKHLDQMGMSLTFKPAAYKIGDHEVDTNTTKVSGPLAQMPMMAMMQSFMTTHATFVDDAAVVSYGDSAKKTLEAVIDGKIEGGLDKAGFVSTAFKDAAPNPFAMGFISVDDVKAQLEGGAAAEPKDGIAFSAGAKDGALIVKLAVPTGEISAVGEAMQQLQSAMMGGMMGPGGAGAPAPQGGSL